MSIRELAEPQQFPTFEETQSIDGDSATKYFECDWSEREYVRPQKYDAYSQDRPDLLCTRIRTTPRGKPQSDGTYTKALIVAEYTTLMPSDQPQESIDFAVDYLETTEGRVWSSDGAAVEVSVPIPYKRMIWTVEVARADLRLDRIAAVIDHVNNLPWKGMAAGTWLAECPSVAKAYANAGQPYWRIMYRFIYRPEGHNVVWRRDKQPQAGWDEMNPRLKDFADFSVLELGIL